MGDKEVKQAIVSGKQEIARYSTTHNWLKETDWKWVITSTAYDPDILRSAGCEGLLEIFG